MIARVTSIKLALTGAAAVLVLSACGAGASGPPSTKTTSPATIGKLQFAVGTANIYGTFTGLNVVSTYRQANGRSAVEVNSPSITGPFTFGALGPGCAGGGGSDIFSTAFEASGPAVFGNGCSSTFKTLDATSVAAVGGPAPSGPSSQELADATVTAGVPSATIMSTPAGLSDATLVCDSYTTCAGVAPNTTTFGQGGGVFAIGLQPANITNSGTPYTGYAPYQMPIYQQFCTNATAGTVGTCDLDANSPTGGVEVATTPWGGPPALDADGKGMGTRDGTYDIGAVLGVTEGVTVFQGLVPSAGTYTMNVIVPTGVNAQGGSSYATITSSSTLTTTTPVIATATSPTLTEDGTGGGTFAAFALPAGATEALIQVVDYGPVGNINAGTGGPYTVNCDTSSAGNSVGTEYFPVYYTVIAHAGGSYTLPDMDGPNLDAGVSSSSFANGYTLCTADQNAATQEALGLYDPSTGTGTAPGGDLYTTQVIAVDYPLYEASPLFGGQAPTITGTGGQADISISDPLAFIYGPGGGALGPFATVHKHLSPTVHYKKGIRSTVRPSAAIQRLL